MAVFSGFDPTRAPWRNVILVAVAAASLGILIGGLIAPMLMQHAAADMTTPPPQQNRVESSAVDPPPRGEAAEEPNVIRLPTIHIVGEVPEQRPTSRVGP